jgi:hypothetical protein
LGGAAGYQVRSGPSGGSIKSSGIGNIVHHERGAVGSRNASDRQSEVQRWSRIARVPYLGRVGIWYDRGLVYLRPVVARAAGRRIISNMRPRTSRREEQ